MRVKTNFLNSVTVNGETYQYFYKHERNNVNGHPRYRVYIIDPGADVVHETILTTYLTINEAVKEYLEGALNNE